MTTVSEPTLSSASGLSSSSRSRAASSALIARLIAVFIRQVYDKTKKSKACVLGGRRSGLSTVGEVEHCRDHALSGRSDAHGHRCVPARLTVSPVERSSSCPVDGLSTVPGWEWRLDGRSGSGWLGEPLSDANETSAVGRCRCGRCARAGQGNAAILLGPAGPTGRYRTTQVDVAAGHSPERHHLDELDEGQASYGSEGWGFESLRAHAVLRQTTGALTCGNVGKGLTRLPPVGWAEAPGANTLANRRHGSPPRRRPPPGSPPHAARARKRAG